MKYLVIMQTDTSNSDEIRGYFNERKEAHKYVKENRKYLSEWEKFIIVESKLIDTIKPTGEKIKW